jgi:hypothetical protein
MGRPEKPSNQNGHSDIGAVMFVTFLIVDEKDYLLVR